MAERLITHLRHVDLAVPDFATQRHFYEEIWGLTPVADDQGIVFLAAVGSPEQYIVRLREAKEKRVDLIALGAASTADVGTLAERLADAGVTLVGDPAKLDTPGGGYGFRFFDTDGRTVEISADVAAREYREVEPHEALPVRLSHVVLNSPAPEAAVAFYEDQLGFSVSDVLAAPTGDSIMSFMRCNPRHHSVAIARSGHAALHHVSFELRGIDEFMRATGRALRAGTTLMWGPGRHLAGDNTFSYFVDPSANVMEYTTELEEVDESTWEAQRLDFSRPEVQDQWGTANAIDDMLTKIPVNPPDPGVFTAPPV
jgi:catechol 2,3-dioxygenase-like lactoylglutathione lyase family enzyme